MALGSFRKQPSEVKDFDVDFTAFFTAVGGDTISVHSAVVSSGNTGSPSDLVLGPGALPITDLVTTTRVKCWVGAGVTGVKYKVTITVTTADLRVEEEDVFVVVKEE